MDDLLHDFLTETFENLDVVDLELVRFEKHPDDTDALGKIFRLVHTIKGTCGFLGLARLGSLAHAAETVLGQFRDGSLEVSPPCVSLILRSIDRIKLILFGLETEGVEPPGDDRDLTQPLHEISAAGVDVGSAKCDPAPTRPERKDSNECPTDVPSKADAQAPVAARDPAQESAVAQQTIRVRVELLERMMMLVSELVLTRNQLMQMVRNQAGSEFTVPLQRLSSVTTDLQDSVMKTRMQPIGSAWANLPRVVRDLAEELDKKFSLTTTGAETELDRQMLALIKDPMVHLLRNAADHGLEGASERRRAGKPETGRITLRASHEGGHIVIELSDDGRGLPTDRIRHQVLRLGLAGEVALARMSEDEIHRFIFNPGFSTAEKVTNVSGRGVGLDVVRNNIEQIGGTIDVHSSPGKGVTFAIKIPLTLAIISALIVTVGGARYAIPQTAILELVRAKPGSDHRIELIQETPVLRLRNRLLPLVELARVLRLDDTPRAAALSSREAFIIVVQVGSQTFGIVVDRVFDTEEIVVKPAASLLRGISVFSGNTILGDGDVVMIIDPHGIAALVSHEAAGSHREPGADAPAPVTAEDKTSLLLFRAGGRERKAVPLSLVTRLEEIDAARIERCDGRDLVQYRGRLMPLIHIGRGEALRREGLQPVLVFAHGDRAIGLAADEIIDIAHERLVIELASTTPGILGSATIRGQATEIIDAGFYLTQVHTDWLERLERHADAGPQKRLLLVDDSPFFLNMLAPLLSAAGYKVTAVPGAAEALELKDKGDQFDIIVSDIEMPDIDGFALASSVRADPKWSSARLIAFTTHTDDASRERGLKAGFDEFISKLDREQLIVALGGARIAEGEAA